MTEESEMNEARLLDLSVPCISTKKAAAIPVPNTTDTVAVIPATVNGIGTTQKT